MCHLHVHIQNVDTFVYLNVFDAQLFIPQPKTFRPFSDQLPSLKKICPPMHACTLASSSQGLTHSAAPLGGPCMITLSLLA